MTMRAHSTAVQESLKGYKFGDANGRQIQRHDMSDKQVIKENKKVNGSKQSFCRRYFCCGFYIFVLNPCSAQRDSCFFFGKTNIVIGIKSARLYPAGTRFLAIDANGTQALPKFGDDGGGGYRVMFLFFGAHFSNPSSSITRCKSSTRLRLSRYLTFYMRLTFFRLWVSGSTTARVGIFVVVFDV